MADNITKHAFGSSANLAGAISGGTVNEYDEVFLTDTNELAYISKEKEVKYVTPRTKEAIKVMGKQNIGALKPNDMIKAGTSLEDFIRMLTQVQVPPVYSQPTIALDKYDDGTSAGTYEAGTTINPKVTATFSQKNAGNLTKIVINKGGSPIEEAESATSPYNYTGESFVLGDETVTFTATATYEEGPILDDNLGQPYPDGHILAGSKTSSNWNYVGARKTFWGQGVGTIPEITSDFIRGLGHGTFNKTSGTLESSTVFEKGNQWIAIAVPAPYKVKTVKYNETNDEGFISEFTTKTVQVADARGEQNGLKDYNVSYYNPVVANAEKMTLVITLGQ